MRTSLIAIAATSLGACTTTADLRAREPAFERLSTKSVSEIAGCIANRLSNVSGIVPSSLPKENGTTVTSTMMFYSSPVVVAVYDIEDAGDHRRTRVYQKTKGDAKNQAQFDQHFGNCF